MDEAEAVIAQSLSGDDEPESCWVGLAREIACDLRAAGLLKT